MIKINEFKPKCYLELPRTNLVKAKFPVIDAHNHLRHTADVKSVLDSMDKFGIRAIVDLDGVPSEDGAEQFKRFGGAHPDRFKTFMQIRLDNIDSPDFEKTTLDHLDRWVAMGAAGLKFHKSLGLYYKDSSGNYILPGDERLKFVWEYMARAGLPVIIHIADPAAFFVPTDETNERYEEIIEHPSWSYYGKGCPGFHELITSQEKMLSENPCTTFIVAHVGSYVENLSYVSQMLDKYANMYVDTAERIAELGRQPYTSRDFFMKYQDRILYGTDLVPNATNTSCNYRFYETRDEYFPYNSFEEHNQGRWYIYGIYLPDDVLRKVYYENAEKVIPSLRG